MIKFYLTKEEYQRFKDIINYLHNSKINIENLEIKLFMKPYTIENWLSGDSFPSRKDYAKISDWYSTILLN